MKSDSKNDTLFAINGAIPGAYNTTIEIFEANNWRQSEIVVPEMMNLFCAAFVNSKTILIAGGKYKTGYNFKTFFLNIETMKWTEGPKYSYSASESQCGRLITSRTPITE